MAHFIQIPLGDRDRTEKAVETVEIRSRYTDYISTDDDKSNDPSREQSLENNNS